MRKIRYQWKKGRKLIWRDKKDEEKYVWIFYFPCISELKYMALFHSVWSSCNITVLSWMKYIGSHSSVKEDMNI